MVVQVSTKNVCHQPETVLCVGRGKHGHRGYFANYAKTIGAWTPCLNMWCGGCYTSSPEVNFFIATETQVSGTKGDQERLNHQWKQKSKGGKRQILGCETRRSSDGGV